MLQNKILFNQSSARLEIFGLSDYSKNESKDQISIISKWKLTLIDKPPIEGNLDHLCSIMNAFYSYSNFLINQEIACYESKLIDINGDNHFTHNVLLKSSKPNIKPLNLKIGNSDLADIINCFDQLNSSNKVKKLKLNILETIPRKGNLSLFFHEQIPNIFPPLLSLCSLLLVSSTLIYFYNYQEEKNNTLINLKIKPNSVESRNTIV